MFKCNICGKEFDKLNSLSVHYRKKHKKTSKELYVELFCEGKIPTCKCGCGEETTFLDITRGFREFIRGHASRVPGKNNFVSKKAQKNSLNTRKKMIKEGKWKPFHLKETGEHWGKGLTKENDERIAKMANSIKSNKKEVERRSRRMSENRKNGTIPTLYKQQSSQWKGGTSALMTTCHANKNLFKRWKYPLMLNKNFTCELCGMGRNSNPRKEIEVHHDKIQMSTIVRLIGKQEGWDEKYTTSIADDDNSLLELKNKISQKVAQYHIDNNISGQVLCKACHAKQHKKYNF